VIEIDLMNESGDFAKDWKDEGRVNLGDTFTPLNTLDFNVRKPFLQCRNALFHCDGDTFQFTSDPV
jgi:hypothetical protein